jgi:hypothetical protein
VHCGPDLEAVIYLTGSGVNPKTLPVLTRHPMIGALTQPASLHLSYVEPFKTWAADNGCFNPKASAAFTLAKYLRWLGGFRSIADRCAFATAPDVLSDAKATWERSAPTFDAIRAAGYKAALVAQNGIEDMSIEWDAFDAIFIGGDTTWKLSRHAQTVCAEAKRRGKWVHMGRVNSQKRLELAWDFGCDSVDGNYLGFGPDTNIPKLLRWLDRAQPRLWS